MKYLLLIAVALVVAVTIAPIAMAQQQQPSSEKHQQQRKRDTDQASPPTLPITNNQSSTYYERDDKNKPQGWHKLIAWPEGVTALAVMLTLCAIVWQAVETRRAAQSMKRSTDLQETALRQWVDMQNWRGCSSLGFEGNTLDIYFDIVNPTNFVLTLETIEATIHGKHFLKRIDYELVPKKPLCIGTDFRLNEKEILQFKHLPLEIAIDGIVLFKEITGKRRPQRFSHSFACVEGNGVVLRKAHKESSWVQNEKEDSERNRKKPKNTN